MPRSLLLIASAGAIALTAGCSAMPGAQVERNMSLYSARQPVVQRTDYVFDVSNGAGGLPVGEAERLRAWFETIDLRYGDRVYIDDSAGYVDEGTRAALAESVGAYGLLLNDGAPVTAGTPAPGTARIVVTRMSASVPGCPDWRSAQYLGAAISTDPNYGCATNSNRAAMIADPADLVRGQAGSPAADEDTGSKAIKAYRDRAPSGASGTVSAPSAGQ